MANQNYQKVLIKLIQSNQSEMVSYFHENLIKRIGAVAQTVYTDVYNSATQAKKEMTKKRRKHIVINDCVNSDQNTVCAVFVSDSPT